MRTAFLALAIVTISVLTASADTFNERFGPNGPSGTEFVERNGPQFLFAWPDEQRDAAIDAMEGLVRSPYMNNDDPAARATHEQRRQNIINKAFAGMPFYDHHWRLIQPFSLIAPDGSTWGIYQFSMSETMMLGLASGWYFCNRAEQDTNDDQAATEHCDDMTDRAQMLNDQVNGARHMAPGGHRD